MTFIIGLQGQSNEGTAFWLGFMQHFDGTTNEKVVMITSKTNTQGTISIPLRNWSQAFVVQANEVTLINMPDFAQTVGSEFVNNNGILVTANSDISVYMHQYFTYRAEASVVLPTDAVGKEYYTMSYEGGTWDGEGYPSEFLIVGAEDNTLIDITLGAMSRNGKPKGSSFSISLDRGETYQVRAEGQSDLTGSHIVSDKPVSVFSGNAWTQIPSECGFRDNLLEQMYPVSTLGTQFVTIPNRSVVYDIYRIMATEDQTAVDIMGSNPRSFTLNAGQYNQFTGSLPSYIVADKPIMVAQYMIGSTCNGLGIGDPAMVLLNSIEQTRDTVTLYNSRLQNIQRNFINIIARTDDVSLISVDGSNLLQMGQVFTDVGFESGFSFIQLEVENGAHTIISDGCGVIATAYGYGEFESYAYSGGASFREINENPLPEGGCLNDTVFFNFNLPGERYSIEWDIGVTEPVFKTSFWHIFDALGTYPARAIVYDECLMQSDTFDREMLISLRQALPPPDDVEICADETIELSAEDLPGATYEWHGPNDYFSEDQFPVIQNADTLFSGSYSVIGIISGCATFPVFTDVIVHPLPLPVLGNDTIFCTRDGIQYLLDPGIYAAYLWQDGSRLSFYQVEEQGTYQVTVEDEFGCEGMDDILIIEQCPTKLFLPNVFTPNGDQRNDVFGVLGNDIVSMHLQVHNRWGALIFETFDQNVMWDGQYRGADAPTGVYTWILSFEGFQEDASPFSDTRTGSVTLLR
jgi:gliding motility-associated-like protein